jgi:hypothetical protein
LGRGDRPLGQDDSKIGEDVPSFRKVGFRSGIPPTRVSHGGKKKRRGRIGPDTEAFDR